MESSDKVRCNRCNVLKDLSEYTNGKKQYKMCGKCRAHVCAWVCSNYKKQKATTDTSEDTKKCTVCFHSKPMDNYKVIGNRHAKMCDACRTYRAKRASL